MRPDTPSGEQSTYSQAPPKQHQKSANDGQLSVTKSSSLDYLLGIQLPFTCFREGELVMKQDVLSVIYNKVSKQL